MELENFGYARRTFLPLYLLIRMILDPASTFPKFSSPVRHRLSYSA
jgi:hypothetical protein